MIAIIDYGLGNLRSAEKGLQKSGHEAFLTSNPDDLNDVDGVVLPGVGAFDDCYDGLCEAGFDGLVKEWAASGRPLLGICVGMQLLFDESEEGAGGRGLGILPGRVVRFPDARETGLKVPHMGWNCLEPVAGTECPLFAQLGTDRYVYFVHSYYPVPEDAAHVCATASYGVDFAAVVGRDNVYATQFHPEKSQTTGIGILRSFGDFVASRSGSATV